MKSRLSISRRALTAVIVMALASQACSWTLIKWPTFPTAIAPTSIPSGPTSTPAPRADATFTVRLPDPLQPGETLVLRVVDEVAGLAYNPVDYELSSVDTVTYTRTLQIPDQAVIRYTYVRYPTATEEDTNFDQPIRYRLFYASGSTQIIDTISSWSDKPANTLSGSIFGTVVDADTNQPIPDILVTAGGEQLLTDSAGRFVLSGLRAGTHNLVAYALDGSYQIFQQGAAVADNQLTQAAQIRLKQQPLVNVTFIVAIPQGTQGTVRLAGNLLQFGNTFADLRGGFSAIADRMNSLQPASDGRFTTTLRLPVGADVQYKYTLGDGYWNSEFTSEGRFVTRRILVGPQDMVVQDAVQSWQNGPPNAPILFDVTVPANTPPGDFIYIQFKHNGWNPPIPMQNAGANHWVFKLYGPLRESSSFSYRYCRNAQCDSADESQFVGPSAHGRNISPTITPQFITDTIRAWAWPQNTGSATLVGTTIPSRGGGFMAGVEFQAYYDPNVPRFNDTALQNIQGIGANWVIYTPTWTYKRVNPNVFTQIPGKDAFWKDTLDSVTQARARNLNVAIFPQPRFEVNAAEFWKTAPRDGNWWNDWFDHYRAFAIHFADQATRAGAQGLIIGGDWILPALPNGKLADGSPSGVPADAEARWKSIIAEVRQHFRGNLIFALPYNSTDFTPPVAILQNTDAVYLLWFAKLSDLATPNKTDMTNEAGRLLDQNIAPWQQQIAKPFILALSYPSSTNSATGCIPSESGTCLDWTALNRPNPDLDTVNIDLQQQVDLYDAVLTALNTRSWVSGFVSRGFFSPVELQDKSASVHGKPARDVLWYWFPRLLGTVQ
jgi:hypothetical protein